MSKRTGFDKVVGRKDYRVKTIEYTSGRFTNKLIIRDFTGKR